MSMPADAITPLLLTLKVALLATALATVFGVAIGKLLGRKRSLLRDTAESLLTLPLVLPPTVLGYYLLLLLVRLGMICSWMQENFVIVLMFT